MKPFLKSLKPALISAFLLTIALPALPQANVDRLDRAARDLVELRARDKSDMSAYERRRWKMEKRRLRAVIAEEQRKQELYERARFGRVAPYPAYGYYGFDAFGNPIGPWNRPNVVIVRPRPAPDCPPYRPAPNSSRPGNSPRPRPRS
jgi:hypothetical protein